MSPDKSLSDVTGLYPGCGTPAGVRTGLGLYRWLRCSPEGERLATGYHCDAPPGRGVRQDLGVVDELWRCDDSLR